MLNGPACVNGLGLGVAVNTFGDSETGGWGSAGDPMLQDVCVWHLWAKDQFTTKRRVVLGTVTLVK